MEGAALLGTLRGKIIRDMLRETKMSCKQISLSIGALLGNLEGIHLPGLSERKG
jgi:hypothetical protein